MLRHTCSLVTSLTLIACASDPPRSFAPVDAAVDDAAPLAEDAGPTAIDAAVPADDAGVPAADSGSDAGPSATDAGTPPACTWPDEIHDGSTCIGRPVDVGLSTWRDVCTGRGGHPLEWRTLEEQARLQTVLFPRLGTAMVGLGRDSGGSWIWADRSPALVTWTTPPMAGHTVANLSSTGATGLFRTTNAGFCVRSVP